MENKKTSFALLMLTVLSISCNVPSYKMKNTITLKGAKGPIGLMLHENGVWISDSETNMMLFYSMDGQLKKTIKGFERPMHIANYKGNPIIPEYGIDSISTIINGKKEFFKYQTSLDAPAGVAIDSSGNMVAIADFYNHRVVLLKDTTTMYIGKKGTEEGEFHYPTDVQIVDSEIWVADAYNHRIQVFDLSGSFKKIIGENDNMNATTGLFVTETEVFATDFENDRLMVYSKDGKLMQIVEGFDNPIDAEMVNEVLYVLDFGSSTIKELIKE